MTPHDLVDDEHPRVGGVLADDVAGEDRSLLRRRPCPEALPDRDDVVVDGLGQAHDAHLVPLVGEVPGEVGRRRARVVSPDGVEDVDTVRGELLRRDAKGVRPLRHEAAPLAVRGIGQLDPGVAERRATMGVQAPRDGTVLRGDLEAATGEQPGVTVEVADDPDLRVTLRVPLDETAHCRGQARGDTARGEHRDGLHGHFLGLQGRWIVSAGRS